MATAAMAIFIIGAETLFLYFREVARRFAIKYDKFKAMKSKILSKNTLLFVAVVLFHHLIFDCYAQQKRLNADNSIETGADQPHEYLPLLQGKKVGLLTNQTSIVSGSESTMHLVDFLIQHKVQLTKIYAPEHGFRGTADAGELIKDGKDSRTGLPIISLYGNNKKPSAEQLKGIDVMVFDLQDVGARFYTYISSLHYLMEACAEQQIPLIILDRPNPKGATVDGPVLEPENKSFVGMHPIPVLHGLTIGEYALMINGEKWLKNGIQADVTIIRLKNYTKSAPYSLPVKPSPNLPNDLSVNLYTSLCFFEGTNVSSGRGTNKQFQIYGSPFLKNMPFTFVPESNEGAKDPMHKGKKCFGEDLSGHAPVEGLSLKWLIKAYKHTEDPSKFFNNFFIKLAGTPVLKQQIEKGMTEEEIRKTWKPGIENFKKTRSGYLLYADF